MKNKFIFLFVLSLAFFSCGNEKPAGEKQTDQLAISGVYEGQIGDKLLIVLSAATTNGKIDGSYFYRKNGIDIAISGAETKDQFEFTETDEKGKITGNFSGTIFSNGDSLAGVWKNADGSRSYPFQLKRSDDPAAAKIRIKTHYYVCKQKTDPDDPAHAPYLEGYAFPEISGMENLKLQRELNAEFYPEEIDENRKNSEYASVKEIPEKEYDKIEWPNGHSTTTVSIDHYTSRVITWSASTEFDGGAHPSFGFYGYQSVFLANGKAVSVNDLLLGDWKPAFLEAIRQSSEIIEWTEGTDDPCGHIRDTLLARVAAWTGDELVYPRAGSLIILADDNRSFGCPEMARGIFEISIEWEVLRPFLRPGNPLELPKK